MEKSINKLLYVSFVTALLSATSCKKEDPVTPVAPVTPTVTSTFCYNFSNSVLPYDSISGGSFITATNNDGFYEVDLGFAFNLCDKSFSKLYIESDYYSTTFTYKISNNNTDLRDYYFVAHGDLDLEPKYNSNFEVVSKLVKTTTGSAGNKVTTIEFRELNYYDFDTQSYSTVNYKMIFRQADNSVSYHYGPNDLTVDFRKNAFEQFPIGLYSTLENDGLFLKGDPSTPTTVINGYVSAVNKWPLKNTHYKFTKK